MSKGRADFVYMKWYLGRNNSRFSQEKLVRVRSFLLMYVMSRWGGDLFLGGAQKAGHKEMI